LGSEQSLHRVYPLGQPLAVIEPVDPDHDRPAARAADEPHLRAARDFGLPERHEFLMIDPDGEGARCNGAAAERYRAPLFIDVGIQLLAAIMEKALEPF